MMFGVRVVTGMGEHASLGWRAIRQFEWVSARRVAECDGKIAR